LALSCRKIKPYNFKFCINNMGWAYLFQHFITDLVSVCLAKEGRKEGRKEARKEGSKEEGQKLYTALVSST